MDQDQLKTSWKVRIVVGIIGFLMLFSTVAVYALIVLSGENEKKTSSVASAELEEVQKEMEAKRKELEALSDELSKEHYDTLSSYRSKVKSYNAKSVDNAGLKTTDLKKGSGAEIKEDSSYYSYYIGWCADESVFDSSFDDYKSPKSLVAPMAYTAGSSSFVAGWEDGVIGMKTGGVREIDIPGELAYGDTQEICGGKNSPLKFIVYVVDPGSEYEKKLEEYNTLFQQYYVLYYSQNMDELGGDDSDYSSESGE